jgi:hypothetical protein
LRPAAAQAVAVAALPLRPASRVMAVSQAMAASQGMVTLQVTALYWLRPLQR